MKTPRASEVSADKVVRTLSGVGNRTETINEAKIEPPNCAASKREKRIGDMALVNSIAKVTAGLKRPPEIRKKIQTLTIREKAKMSAMY